MEDNKIKKIPVIVNITISMLIVWLQAIVRLYYLQEKEFILLKFMSAYLIICYAVYLYSFCKEKLFILESFKGFYRFLLIYLFIFMITYCVIFHTCELFNDFIIDVNKRTIDAFRGMSPIDAYKKSVVILYCIEIIQLLFFIYSVYNYIIATRFVKELKKRELKEYEEAIAREGGIIMTDLEEDENRTVINIDVNVHNNNNLDDVTVINDGDLETAVEDHIHENTVNQVERFNETSRNE